MLFGGFLMEYERKRASTAFVLKFINKLKKMECRVPFDVDVIFKYPFQCNPRQEKLTNIPKSHLNISHALFYSATPLDDGENRIK